MTKIKNCPFCNGKGIATKRDKGWTVDCENSNMWSMTLRTPYLCPFWMWTQYPTEEEAIAMWNKRKGKEAK